MNLFILCVLSLIAVASADDAASRGCIYILGRCSSYCPEGTHSYTTGCGYLTPEATCDEPNPVQDTRGKICDYSACYCDHPTVRDKSTDKCVLVENCPETRAQTSVYLSKKEIVAKEE